MARLELDCRLPCGPCFLFLGKVGAMLGWPIRWSLRVITGIEEVRIGTEGRLRMDMK